VARLSFTACEKRGGCNLLFQHFNSPNRAVEFNGPSNHENAVTLNDWGLILKYAAACRPTRVFQLLATTQENTGRHGQKREDAAFNELTKSCQKIVKIPSRH